MDAPDTCDRFRLCIVAGGSRGDVDPYIALGMALQSRGYGVRLCTSDRYEAAARTAGLDFRALSWTDQPHPTAGKDLAASHRSLPSFLRSLRRLTTDTTSGRYAAGFDACRDARLIVTAPLAFPMSYSLGERLGVPVVRAFYSPATPTGDYPAMILPHWRWLPRRFNAWTHAAIPRTALLLFRRQVDRARRDVLGLGPIPPDPLLALDERRVPALYGYSPAVCPPPPEFGPWIHVTGYWRLPHEQAWHPPADLVRFLNSGPPPVYIGFGSMTVAEPETLTALVVDALGRAGHRGVLARGWGGLSTVHASHVHVLDDVPHEWLFPRMAAAVHHGGAGTTGASLRAGLPTIVVPFGLPDQHFWGARVAILGAGPAPIRRARLTAKRLADAIRAALEPAVRQRAADLGRRIRSEDGLARAVSVIDDYVRTLPDVPSV